MKGVLKKIDNEWFVTHIMDDNGIKFGVDYPVRQELFNRIKNVPIIVLEEGKEVEFHPFTLTDDESQKKEEIAILIPEFKTFPDFEPFISDNFQIGPDGAFEKES